MPNQPAADRAHLSLRMPRELKKRLSKAARKNRTSLTDYVERVLDDSVRHVELTPEEYEEIAKETRRFAEHIRSLSDKKASKQVCEKKQNFFDDGSK